MKTSSDSLIVHESVAEDLTTILSEQLSSRPAKAQVDTPMGYRGLLNEPSAHRVNALIQDAIDKGAKVIAGKQASTGNVIQPIILEGTRPEMRIYGEEIFGPAMTLNRFKTVEEAVEMANASDYGLAASIYGVRDIPSFSFDSQVVAEQLPLIFVLPLLTSFKSNEAECFAIARQIESGQVHINGATVHDSQVIPHGGKQINSSCPESYFASLIVQNSFALSSYRYRIQEVRIWTLQWNRRAQRILHDQNYYYQSSSRCLSSESKRIQFWNLISELAMLISTILRLTLFFRFRKKA